MIQSEEQAKDWLAAFVQNDPKPLEQLELLQALLTEENQRQNLVAAASLPQIWQRHFADSAQLLSHVPRETRSPWIDLGTGAGFPGLVIAIVRRDVPVFAVESRPRRIAWLAHVREKLGLDQLTIVGSRLETVDTFAAGVISARAFAPLDRLLELSVRFSTADTIWVLPKGRSARDEVAGLSRWQHTFHVEQSLTDPDAGIVVGNVSGRIAGRRAQTG